MGNLNDFLKDLKRVIVVGAIIYCVDFVGEGINAFRNDNVYSNQLKYISREEIKKDFKIEKKKLGLENLDIELNIFEGEKIAYIEYTYAFDSYLLNFNFSKGSRVVLRHELCHAKNDNFPNYRTFNLPIIRQFQEWNATSCSFNE